ncbi:2-oxoglutarate dehydrogenase complex dihydrolipoyllysine-residue succinyltransferase [Pseudalkalibacillus berkeleyi]|uniref:Dihydrolipoyllysine-residue succinyltransferase component of 2-oxoglutarate dehydrogenase complex n=1 Tax=Pseudalkalibacillus berkeleyi TaxID=1069813 RepID=A0ABS9H0E1_9BACL|nr:2-oxoglutarate dehydrogenase complex dihydrolipoyllysine-residue succinyltransferase [Pseudalkalibacillus berkeleyi]MCF6137486.1 2-oxoglutarate dehydrogenase complex dihydrolipoyllysine-residue succinyltransferase [Pseudalkalibacillus berkeleyi]
MIEIKVPELAESISEGTISEWLVNKGDKVSKGDPVCELETDKVNVEVSAENDGVITEFLKESGDTVEVGEVIAKLDEAGEGSSAPSDKDDKEEAPKQEVKEEKSTKEEKAPASQETEEEEQDDTDRTLASPATRKLARKLGVDLNKVKATDPLGRVRSEDVKAHAEQGNSEKESAKKSESKSSKPSSSTPEQNFEKPVERVKMSRRRQTIAKRLVEAQQTAAMLTTYNEVDLTAVNDLRKRRKEQFLEQNDVKLGYMSFFTKAVVAALKKFPRINAEIQGDEILLKKFYDIGIAVGAEEGLVVPVVRDADKLSFAGIEQEIKNLSKKVKSKKLTIEELQGGTFTITNGGVFGSLMSSPILNSPQVGILGMHKIQWRPVAIDEERMENRPMMYIALSYDHRIVDGSEAVSFLVKIKELLEDPESLLLEG